MDRSAMDTNPIVAFYGRSDEHGRMARNPLEYVRSKELLARHLPPPPCRVLDVGGATGAYSFWLADLGYEVTLVDFSPHHIDAVQGLQQTAAHRLKAALVGDARGLEFADDSFDAVLVMGPLYHLLERNDRVRALSEARRAVVQGGLVAATVISRYASMMDGFFEGLIADPEFVPIMHRDLQTGIHQDTSRAQQYFTDAYLHRPDELEAEWNASGLNLEGIRAITSFGWTIPDLTTKWNDLAFRENLLATIRLVDQRPELLGVSSHLMALGRK